MTSKLKKICMGGESCYSKNDLEQIRDFYEGRTNISPEIKFVPIAKEEVERISNEYDPNFSIELADTFINWLVGDIGFGHNKVVCHELIKNVLYAFSVVEDSAQKIEALILLLADGEITLASKPLLPPAYKSIAPEYFTKGTSEIIFQALTVYKEGQIRHISSQCETIAQEKSRLEELDSVLGSVYNELVSILRVK